MSEPNVNVAIMSGNEISFELYGRYKIDKTDHRFSGRCRAIYDGQNIKLTCNDKTLIFDTSVILKASDIRNESFLLNDVVIGKEFHWETKEKQRFTGSLRFMIEENKLTAVNILPVEDYLMSVISSEMSSRSSLQFLKAHAIISRSWLISQIEKRKSKQGHKVKSLHVQTDEEIIKWYDREDHLIYDVCADDHCQRYQGITKVYTDAARKAIDETRGLVLMYNRAICDARYSKCCGGITEAFENTWEPVQHGYLKSIVDYRFEPDDYSTDLRDERFAEKWIRNKPAAFCNTKEKKLLAEVLVDFDQSTTDFYRWKAVYEQDELKNIIKEKSGNDFGDIIDLIPVERGFSGRLIKLKIAGTKKTQTIGKELEIRKMLAKSHLYSSAFVIDKENIINGIPQKFILIGAGWGHGVGLCQIGAAVMSNLGYSFDEILSHYFKGSILQNIYQ